MTTFLRDKYRFFSRLKSLTRFQRFNYKMGDGGLQAKFEFNRDMGSASNSGKKHPGDEVDVSKWKRIDARKFGLTHDIIPPSSMIVLQLLRNNGYDAYFVGGCVRDLLLQRTPKDFDVITTANLKQIKKVFHRAQIIGKRFPICLVHIKGSIVEVSSFETTAKTSKENEEVLESPVCGSKDFIRWRNSMQRDFTINSLFYDPFSNKIYDYINGMSDLRSLKLRTLIPARVSFKEDCARILRGLRIAARLNLSFSKDAEGAIHDFSSSVETIDKFRLMLEMNYMMSYGAAEGSICLLQRFNLLEILLPFHAAYLDQQKSAQNPIMLSKLLSNLDKWLSCDRPADSSLWVGLLVFHLALVIIPQDALVVWTFASVLYHGRWEEGVKFAREHANKHVNFVPEILESTRTTSDEDLAKLVARLASLVRDSIYVLTERNDLSLAMSQYPSSRCSGLVFIPKRIGSYVAQIFGVLLNDIASYEEGRESFEINYRLLGKGNPCETRFMLGKIILETMNGGVLVEGGEAIDDEEDWCPHTFERPPLFEIIKSEVQSTKRQRHNSSLAEPEQQTLKMPKLVETAKKQYVIDKENFLSFAENIEKAVWLHSLSEEYGKVMNGNKLEKSRSSSSHPKKTRKMQGAVGNSKHQDAAENHIAPEERKTQKKQGAVGNIKYQNGAEEKKAREKQGFSGNGKHQDEAESHKTSEKGKTRKKHQEGAEKHKPLEDRKTREKQGNFENGKHQDGAENHKTPKESKTGEQKEEVVKKKDKQFSLSSLFRI